MKTFCVEADKNNLPSVLEFVLSELPKSTDSKFRLEIELICEEIFVNICSYAYDGKVGSAVITADITDNAVTLSFSDSGTPFNPLEKADPDIHTPLEERNIGGLGIFMTKKSADKIFYQRTDGHNILTVIKNY